MINRLLQYKVPRWSVFVLDTLIVVFSILTAYMLRFNFNIPSSEMEVFKQAFAIILGLRVVSFIIFRIHSGIIQYTSTRDASRIFLILFGGSLLFALANVISFNTGIERYLIPYSIIILEFITSLMFLVGYRVFVKIAYVELAKPHSGQTRVMIFGAGEAGIITKRALEAESKSKVKVVGFFDDNQKKKDKRLDGLIIYPTNDIRQILKEKEIDQLILAVQNLNLNRKQELIDICMEYDVEVLNVPPVQNWINGELSFKQIKSVKIEDLLEREVIKLSEEHVKKDLRNKVVLISGAAGSIGSEIVRQVIRFQPKAILMVDQAESPLFHLELNTQAKAGNIQMHYILADVTNRERMQAIFHKFQPDYVFHAAAYKHVPMMEKNPMEAVRVNVLGTKNLADLAMDYTCSKFVMISTDKAVNPTNVMGASKRLAEIYVQSVSSLSKTQFITTRFGNVLGSNGSVIPLFEKQIAGGGPITVTHPDITRYFMTIPEACQLVLEAGSMGEGGEIFVFDMGASVKIVDLAKKMIRLSGLQLGKDIQIVFTGLRPGEKLYEELLTSGENIKSTHHHKILKADIENMPLDKVQKTIHLLKEAQEKQDAYRLVSLLKDMIPEYKSENSEFGILDL
jgi:FlaA1/EpsC-like NDP-sugar epimerase